MWNNRACFVLILRSITLVLGRDRSSMMFEREYDGGEKKLSHPHVCGPDPMTALPLLTLRHSVLRVAAESAYTTASP